MLRVINKRESRMTTTAKLVTTTAAGPQATGPNPSPDEAPALPLLMRIDHVMLTLAISRRTVYELIKDKKLTAVRVGVRGSRVTTESVLAVAGTAYKPLRIPRLRNQNKDELEAAAQSP